MLYFLSQEGHSVCPGATCYISRPAQAQGRSGAKQRLQWLELNATSDELRSGGLLKAGPFGFGARSPPGTEGLGQNHRKTELSFSKGGQYIARPES